MTDPKPTNKILIPIGKTDLSTDQVYTDLLDRCVVLWRTGQARALQVMHKMGGYVDDFLNEQEDGGSKRYGSRNMIRLSEDLAGRGVEACAPSTLYHCRKLFLVIKEADIERLASRGYSTAHVKALLPLSDEIRARIQCEMVDTATNEVIPINVLEHKIREAQTAAQRTAADNATAADPAGAVQAAAAQGPANTGDAATENGYTDTEGHAAEGAEGNPALEAGAAGPAPAGASTNTTKDFTAPPMVSVKAMAKVCDQFVALVPGVTKSCREVDKIGFDSPKAAGNWCLARDTCIDALKGAQQYLDGILETLVAEKNSGGSENFKDSAPKPKGKGKKRR